MRATAALTLALTTLAYAAPPAKGEDSRYLHKGHVIPSQGYCDQPYVVVLDDGTWLCTLTTGPGKEGATGQHVVSTRSSDQGQTWQPLVDIEPVGPPEASWVMPLKTPGGRVYAFYDYNADNLRSVNLSNGGTTPRVDTLGQYVCKYTDDGGRTWSAQRYTIPIREFQIDRENVYGGAVRFMWGVGKPIIHEGAVYVGLSKVGNFGQGFIERSEGIFLKSDNLLTEPDPAKHHWETLPDGDIGLRAPAGPIAEEHNLTFLSDGSLFCTYRTTQSHPCHAYSRDGGHTWTPPAWMTYAPGGRVFKHSRAANFVRRFSNGKHVYWFHNHGGTSYEGRNPAWLCGGVEKDGYIYWSQPEILLYDDNPGLRMSYPDFIEDQGRFFVTETQKTVARVHEIPRDLLDMLWGQFDNHAVARDDLALELAGGACRPGATADVPPTPAQGFTLDIRFKVRDITEEQLVLDARDAEGTGSALAVVPNGAVVLIGEGQRWESDPGVIAPETTHNATVIYEGGPRLLLFVVDGVLCDGGDVRAQGWYRLDPASGDLSLGPRFAIPPTLRGAIDVLRFYTRPLRVSEAVGNHAPG